MVLAFLLAFSLADWVPARWASAEPQSLELLKATPINCLLLERDQWSAAFAERATGQGIATLGVVHPGGDPREAARLALARKLTGIVLEGDFSASAVEQVRDTLAGSQAPVIEMLPRRSLRSYETKGVLATYQGLWPGIQVQENGATRAGPTGSPWFDTNTGFLLFARAAASAPIWIGNLPPPNRVLPVESYLHAICDAAVQGARWVVALDDDFSQRLLRREAAALKDWNRLALYLEYFEKHKEWRSLPAYGQLAVVQDADSGALVSGSILDMLSTKHMPVRVVPRSRLSPEALRGSKMALNLESELLTPQQSEALNNFARTGGTLLTSPPESKPPVLHGDQITVDEKEVGRIDDLWRGLNSMIGRTNLGVRLFHVSGMLSDLLVDRAGKRLVLHLVNYTGYPVENITVQFPSSVQRARIMSPEGAERQLEVYRASEGAEVDIDKISVCATLIVE